MTRKMRVEARPEGIVILLPDGRETEAMAPDEASLQAEKLLAAAAEGEKVTVRFILKKET